MPGSSNSDEKARAMKAFVGAPSAGVSLLDVERMYYWMKLGNALPVNPARDTTELSRLWWNAGVSDQTRSNADLELAFYRTGGAPASYGIDEAALFYWSSQ